MIITIDGTTGSGKSTAAANLASHLGIRHLDTGAMYRALTLKALDTGIDLADDLALAGMAAASEIELQDVDGKLLVRLDGHDVTEDIRENRVSVNSHYLAAAAQVRRILVRKQREFAARANGVVTEGRDQGTVVFPKADVKFYLDAAPEERARRRQKELEERGEVKSFRTVLGEVNARDLLDSTREVDPLRPAEGSVHVDTTDYTPEQTLERLLAEIRQRVKESA
jgi:cytidylate kinase